MNEFLNLWLLAVLPTGKRQARVIMHTFNLRPLLHTSNSVLWKYVRLQYT